jgi:imidazole glycerol-phosphate synthase subunit HisH
MSNDVSVGIVDYGMGNRRSVQKAFEHVGARVSLTSDPETLGAVDGLVVPGVGAFPEAMNRLRERGLDELVLARARERTPILGICLGMQLLFDSSAELGTTTGLGLIAGNVTPLRAGGKRIPHIGWNEVEFRRPNPLTSKLPADGCAFYHVHSLAARPADPDDVIATTTYGERFATIVGRGSIFGVQFHPEKSSTDGLALLGGFVELCRDSASHRKPHAVIRA